MLKIGDRAPQFSLTDQDGKTHTLQTLIEDGPVLVFFYPADFSPVCSAEACVFRDNYGDVLDIGAKVVGISPQSGTSHKRFARTFGLPFPLLADPRRRAIRGFGVEGLFGMVRRVTFLIDADGTVANRVEADFDLSSHAGLLRRTVREARESSAPARA